MMAGRDTTVWGVDGGLARHIPVMLHEVIAALEPRDGAVYVDGTFGAGGYSKAILDAADCSVIAIDRDPDAIKAAQNMACASAGRLRVAQGRFSEMARIARQFEVDMVDGVVLDIGVSSMQLDEAERGFSFMADGPLDMRMERSGISAADVVNRLGENDLADVIYLLGEEKRSRAVARAIVGARNERVIARTSELAAIVARAVGPMGRDKKHPATRTFQALRIYVNRELQELGEGLFAAEALLREGGRLVIVTFHSLEDRIVKLYFAKASGREPSASRHLPATAKSSEPIFTLLAKGGAKPSREEEAANPRARSARMRAGIRTAAPPRKLDLSGLGLPEIPQFAHHGKGVVS